MNTSNKVFPDGDALIELSFQDVERENEANDSRAMDVDHATGYSKDAVENETSNCRLEVRHSILSRVAGTDAYFKQQSMTDPDLTFSEKFAIASDLLERKPATFLERYGKYLVKDDLLFFEPFQDDYVVDFRVCELNRGFSNVAKANKKVKNRRYEAMKRLIGTGEYFSDDEMKKRDPLLYEEMIGRFLTNEDVAKVISKSDLSLSEVLLSHLQAMQNNELYDHQQQQQQTDVEEYDSDESEEENEEMGQPSEKEKANLRSEFLEIMQQRFLSGQDEEFDYGEVDNSEDYDPIDLYSRDEEDRYFAGDYSDSDSDLQGDGS